MYSFYIITILVIALLYSHRKRLFHFAKTWQKNSEVEESAQLVERTTSIGTEAVTRELKAINETLSKLPDLILADLHGQLEQEQQFRVQILTDRVEMRSRLENFDALARVLHQDIALLGRFEKNIKERGDIDLSQSAVAAVEATRVQDEEEMSWVQSESPISPESPAAAWSQTTELERFIDQNIEEINRAGYDGLRGIRSFLANRQRALEVHSPADGIVVLTEHEAGPSPEGRAFVLPGQLLGRPWVEWFEVPGELVRPIETTVLPAVVYGRGDGTWELKKRGRVNQQ